MLPLTFWNHITSIILCNYIILTTSTEPALVTIPAGIVGKQNTVLIGKLGGDFEQWCLTYGDPPPEVNWFQILGNDKRHVTRRNLLQLQISNTTVGDYMCEANNSADHVASWLVIIQAYQTEDVETDNPHILPRLKINKEMIRESQLRRVEKNSIVKIPAGIVGKQNTVLIGKLGEDFEQWCLTYGDPPPEVNWFQFKGYNKTLVAEGNLLQLQISNTTVGDYMCEANNSADHVASWLVIIQAYQTEDVETDNPHILPRLKINKEMIRESQLRRVEKNSIVKIPAGIVGKQNTVLIGKLGEDFEQWCLTYGDPPPEVNWFQIVGNDKRHVTRGNLLQLQISNTTVSDYMCEAKNSADHVASWQVIIQAYQKYDEETDNPYILPRLKIENYKYTYNRTKKKYLLDSCRPFDTAFFSRWRFNRKTRRCEEFIWNGRGDNTNIFNSQIDCIKQCGLSSSPYGADKGTSSTPSTGIDNFSDDFKRWYYKNTKQDIKNQFQCRDY